MRLTVLSRRAMRVVCLTGLVAGLVTLAPPHPTLAAQADPTETRALWVTRTTLGTPAAVARLVQAASSSGFNTLIVQVRGRGDAYYRSSIEPRAAELASRPAFDPLADTLRLARRAGLKVHAWVAVNLVSSAVDLPASKQHVIYRHPEWLMVPRALAGELRGVSPRSPDYVRRLARWTRARPDEVEGLYVSPVHPAAVAHIVNVVRDLVSKYEVDGIHLDYVRFPNDEFDYSRSAVDEFKQVVRAELTAGERRRTDAEDKMDPRAYPNRFPARWIAFRQARLTRLVVSLRTAVKRLKPQVTLSAAVVPDLSQALESKMQDWRAWLDQSILDVLCPMAYTQDVALFERQIGLARDYAGNVPVWAGVGAYRLTTDATLAHIRAARRRKAGGIILFSYDALVAPPNSPTTLAELGRAAFGSGSP